MLRLGEDVLHRAAAVPAAQRWDDAVASSGLSQPRRCGKTRCSAASSRCAAALHRRVDVSEVARAAAVHDLLNCFGDPADSCRCREPVHSGSSEEKFLSVALGQAAGHQNLPEVPRSGIRLSARICAMASSFALSMNAQVFRTASSASGGSATKICPRFGERHHLFGINEVLVAAERHECNPIGTQIDSSHSPGHARCPPMQIPATKRVGEAAPLLRRGTRPRSRDSR